MPVAKMFEDVTKKSVHVPELSKLEDILEELIVKLNLPDTVLFSWIYP